MGSLQVSRRIRPALRRRVFTDRVGGNLKVMQRCWEFSIDLHVEATKPGDHGAGKPLPQDWS